jgi:urea transport system permease protein
MGIVPSIEMVLWVAIGGRSTIGGAVLGALLTNAAKTTFSEAYPEWWPIMLGAMFIIVVLLLPKGIVGTIAHYTSNWNKPMLPKSVSSQEAS